MAEKKRAKRAAGFIVQYSLQVQCTAGARGAERREAVAAASSSCLFVRGGASGP